MVPALIWSTSLFVLLLLASVLAYDLECSSHENETCIISNLELKLEQECVKQVFTSDVRVENSYITLDNTACVFEITAGGYSITFTNSQILASKIIIHGADINVSETASLVTTGRGVAADSRQDGTSGGGGGHAGYGGTGCSARPTDNTCGSPAGSLFPDTSGGAARSSDGTLVVLGGGYIFVNATNSLVVDGMLFAEGDTFSTRPTLPTPAPTAATFAALARGADASILAQPGAWEFAGGVRAMSWWLHAYALQIEDDVLRMEALRTLPRAITRASVAIIRQRIHRAAVKKETEVWEGGALSSPTSHTHSFYSSSASHSSVSEAAAAPVSDEVYADVVRAALQDTPFARAIPTSPRHVLLRREPDSSSSLSSVSSIPDAVSPSTSAYASRPLATSASDEVFVAVRTDLLVSPLLLLDVTPRTLPHIHAHSGPRLSQRFSPYESMPLPRASVEQARTRLFARTQPSLDLSFTPSAALVERVHERMLAFQRQLTRVGARATGGSKATRGVLGTAMVGDNEDAFSDENIGNNEDDEVVSIGGAAGGSIHIIIGIPKHPLAAQQHRQPQTAAASDTVAATMMGMLTGAGKLDGAGTISVMGGDGYAGGGSGSGGRVAVMKKGNSKARIMVQNGMVDRADACQCGAGGLSSEYDASRSIQTLVCNGRGKTSTTPLALEDVSVANVTVTSCFLTAQSLQVSGDVEVVASTISTSANGHKTPLSINAQSLNMNQNAQVWASVLTIACSRLLLDGTSSLFFTDMLDVTTASFAGGNSIQDNPANPASIANILATEQLLLSSSIVKAGAVTLAAPNVTIVGSAITAAQTFAPGVCSDPISAFCTPYSAFHEAYADSRHLPTTDLSMVTSDISSFPPTSDFATASTPPSAFGSGSFLLPARSSPAPTLRISAHTITTDASVALRGAVVALCADTLTLNGTISASTLGCPSGAGEGTGVSLDSAAGGAGYISTGGDAYVEKDNSTTPTGGRPYVSYPPARVGSGGAETTVDIGSGGSGGGVVYLLGTDTSTLNLAVSANGGTSKLGAGGGGSGGAVYLKTRALYSTQLSLSAQGGDGYKGGGGGSGGVVFVEWAAGAPHGDSHPVLSVGGGKGGPPEDNVGASAFLSYSLATWEGVHMDYTTAGGYSDGRYDGGTGSVVASPACKPGTYGFFCSQCDPGRYAPEPGLSVCVRCPMGRFQVDAGASTCDRCERGRYATEGQSSCALCDAGRYAPQEGMGECTECEPGRYAEGGQSTCATCGPNTRSHRGKSTCQLCEPGKYSDWGSEQCSLCENAPHHSFYTQPGCSYRCEAGYVLPECDYPLPRLVAAMGGLTVCLLILAGAAGLALAPFVCCWCVHRKRAQEMEQRDIMAAATAVAGGDVASIAASTTAATADTMLGDPARYTAFSDRLALTYADIARFAYRIYFSGSNTYDDPLRMSVSAAAEAVSLISEASFTRFAAQISQACLWTAREKRVYMLLCCLYYPLSQLYHTSVQRRKLRALEHVVATCDNGFLRDPQAKALADCLRCGHSRCLTLAWIDILHTTAPTAASADAASPTLSQTQGYGYGYHEIPDSSDRGSSPGMDAGANVSKYSSSSSPALIHTPAPADTDANAAADMDRLSLSYILPRPPLPLVLVCAGTGTYSSPFHLECSDPLIRMCSAFFGPHWFAFLAHLNTVLRTIPSFGVHSPRHLAPALRYLSVISQVGGIGIGAHMELAGMVVELGCVYPRGIAGVGGLLAQTPMAAVQSHEHAQSPLLRHQYGSDDTAAHGVNPVDYIYEYSPAHAQTFPSRPSDDDEEEEDDIGALHSAPRLALIIRAATDRDAPQYAIHASASDVALLTRATDGEYMDGLVDYGAAADGVFSPGDTGNVLRSGLPSPPTPRARGRLSRGRSLSTASSDSEAEYAPRSFSVGAKPYLSVDHDADADAESGGGGARPIAITPARPHTSLVSRGVPVGTPRALRPSSFACTPVGSPAHTQTVSSYVPPTVLLDARTTGGRRVVGSVQGASVGDVDGELIVTHKLFDSSARLFVGEALLHSLGRSATHITHLPHSGSATHAHAFPASSGISVQGGLLGTHGAFSVPHGGIALDTQYDAVAGMYLPVERHADADSRPGTPDAGPSLLAAAMGTTPGHNFGGRAADSPGGASNRMHSPARARGSGCGYTMPAFRGSAMLASGTINTDHQRAHAYQHQYYATDDADDATHSSSLAVSFEAAPEPLPYACAPISHILALPREQRPRFAAHCWHQALYASCLSPSARNTSFSTTVFALLLLTATHVALLLTLAVVFAQLLPLHLYAVTLLVPPLVPLLLPIVSLHALATRSTRATHAVPVLGLLGVLNSLTTLGVGLYAHLVMRVMDVEALILPTLMLFVTMLLCPAANAYVAHLQYKEDVLLCRTDYLQWKLQSRPTNAHMQ